MKTSFKYYSIIWAISVGVFNVIVFAISTQVLGLDRLDASFWVGYISIMFTFIVQLGIAWYSLKDNVAKIFYNMSLLSISQWMLILMLVVGILCMVIPGIPAWLSVIFCLLVLAFSLISMLQAQAAASIVGDMDVKIKNKTFFIKSLTMDIDSLIAQSATREIMDEMKTLYDAARYSDPMSSEALSGVETQITLKVSELSEGVRRSDAEIVKRISNEVKILLNDRNKKCMLLK